MRALLTLHLIGFVGFVGLVACSGSKEEGDDDNNSGFKPGVGGNGNGSGQYAQNTVDGRAPISEATAASLTGDANACAKWSETAQGNAAPILEFVIDASGSMDQDPANPSDPNSPSKWEGFSDTMPDVFASLPSTFAVGVSYYNKPNRGCFALNQAVPIGILDANKLNQVNQSLSNTQPGGYTPTYNAWRAGLDTVQSWQAPTGYESSPRYIVLITDGVPTVRQDGCETQNPISQQEYDAQLQLVQSSQGNVKTVVVGVVGSDTPQAATYDPLYMLSRFAQIGGTASANCVPKSGTPSGTTVSPRGTYCHFDLSQADDFATALKNSLGSIVQSVVSCEYNVPAPPSGQVIDTSQIVLVYNDGKGNYSLILQNTSTTCDKGWQFTDSTNSKIQICGTSCDVIQNDEGAQRHLGFWGTSTQVIN